MRLPAFIARRIAFSGGASFSRFIVRMAIGAVALSMTVMIVATSLVSGFQNEISRKVYGFWAHVHVLPFGLTDDMSGSPLADDARRFIDTAQFPDVEHVQASALKGAIVKTRDAFEGIVLKGAGPDFAWQRFGEYVHTGRPFRSASDGSFTDSILISSTTARRLEVDTGDVLTLQFIERTIRLRRVTVGGIYDSGLEEFDERYAVVDLALIQDLNGWGRDSVGGFEIFLRSESARPDRFKRYAAALLGPVLPQEVHARLKEDPVTRAADDIYYQVPTNIDVRSIRQLRPAIFDWIDLQTTNELIILILMILVAGFNMSTALLILILERTNMVGILKSMGATDRQVRRIFVWNGSYIIAVGLVVGNVIGLGLCALQSSFGLLTLPEDSYYVRVAPVDVQWTWILILNVLTLAIATAVLLLPASLVTRIEPVKAIRFD